MGTHGLLAEATKHAPAAPPLGVRVSGPASCGTVLPGLLWVAVMGLGFVGIFVSWFGTQSFAVKLLGDEIGTWLLGIVYGCFIVSNQVAPSVVGALGAKWTMIAGAAGYFLGIAGAATQSAVWTLLGAGCLGVGAGCLWSGQGRMLTDLSDDQNRGRCWGVFDALMMGGSALIGNIITLNFAPVAVHDEGSQAGSAAACGGTCEPSCPTGAGSAAGSDLTAVYDSGDVRTYFTILCFPVCIGIAVLACLPNMPKPKEGALGLGARLQRTWDIMSTREMLLLAPYCFHIGVSIGFGVYFYSIVQDTKALVSVIDHHPASPHAFPPRITQRLFGRPLFDR
jgi:hypothetical protein